MSAAIQINQVRKSFSGTEVLKNISLQIPAGSVTVILGPSGSGSRPCCAASITWKNSTAEPFEWVSNSSVTAKRQPAV